MADRVSHDQNFKNLILDYPRQALAFFVPAATPLLEDAVEIIPLRQEQLQRWLGERYREVVLHQPHNYGFSCFVSVHGKARLAGKGLSPCQEVQRSPWALTKQPVGRSCDVPQPRCSACQGGSPFPGHCALL